MKNISVKISVAFITGFLLLFFCGCQRNEKTEAVQLYYFSPVVGVQETDNGVWYEMVDAPISLKKENSTIIIKNVIWKDEKIICEFEFENVQYENIIDKSGNDNKIKVYLEEQKTMGLQSDPTWIGYDEDRRYIKYLKTEFSYPQITNEISFNILGEKCTVVMEPLSGYKDLKEIGSVQSHNGRSIILNEVDNELKAYSYSDNIWKIKALGEWNESKWISDGILEDKVFTYCENNLSQIDNLTISPIRLVAECESLDILLNIQDSNLSNKVPFLVGEDKYCITHIQTLDELNGKSLLVYVKPIDIEEGTELFGIEATVGFEESLNVHEYYSPSGDLNMLDFETVFHECGTNKYNPYFIDENFELTEPVIKIWLDSRQNVPEEIVLKIKKVYKNWNQEYHFEMNK